MTVRRPDAAVVVPKDVGDAEVVVGLFMVGPCPDRSDDATSRWIPDRDGLDRDVGEDRVPVRGAADSARCEAGVREGLEHQQVVVPLLEPVGDHMPIVGGRFAGDQDGAVFEDGRGRAVQAAGGHGRWSTPAVRPDSTKRRQTTIDLGGLLGGGCEAFRLESRDLRGDAIQPRAIGVPGKLDRGFERAVRVGKLAVDARLRHVVEERDEPVEVLLADRIELVVVTSRAADGEPEPDRPGRLHPVDRVLQQVFVLDGAAFVAGHVVAVESARDELVERGILDEIPRELVDGEPIEGHVLAKRPEHPVAIGPHLLARVHVDARGIGVSREIQPRGRHPFGVSRAIRLLGQQPIQQALVGVGSLVGDESIDLVRRRWKSGEIQERPPCEDGSGRGGVGFQAAVAKGVEDESVQVPNRPGVVVEHRRVDRAGRFERPVRLVSSALGDPATEERHLFGAEPFLPSLRGRHHVVGIVGGDPIDQQRALGMSRHDRRGASNGPRGRLEVVESKAGLSGRGIGAVAGEASVREDRPDVPPISDFINGG